MITKIPKTMEAYKNLNGDSGVLGFEIGNDFIIVQFEKGGTYVYNYSRPGSSHVEEMKALAISGRGLNAYINIYVKKRYDSKF